MERTLINAITKATTLAEATTEALENLGFDDAKVITRGDLAMILGTAFPSNEVQTVAYTDVSSDLQAYVQACASTGLLIGKSETTFDTVSTLQYYELACVAERIAKNFNTAE
ncbi:MAG: hypothetical protein ATN35_04240 [Epulopiscium sp. Nele67-Bin004]|nr:MAG: hypothetical protein ATN35_04240 [Epulopiscium sp. Nele67-Bin004]